MPLLLPSINQQRLLLYQNSDLWCQMPAFKHNRDVVSFMDGFKQFSTTQHVDVSKKEIIFISTRIGDILCVRELSIKKARCMKC